MVDLSKNKYSNTKEVSAGKMEGDGHRVGYIYIFWRSHAACKIVVPQPGIEPGAGSEGAES